LKPHDPARQGSRVVCSRTQNALKGIETVVLMVSATNFPASSRTRNALPGKRAKLLFYVAVVRPLGRVITMMGPWLTQEATAKFLAKIRRTLKGEPVDLIYDNAPHHKGPIVEEALVRHHLHRPHLPPYSPQMNAAEPWIGWSKEVLSAHYGWQEHGALVRSFIGFVASMAKRSAEVLRRCVPDMLGGTCM
jgi:hypothetical protein